MSNNGGSEQSESSSDVADLRNIFEAARVANQKRVDFLEKQGNESSAAIREHKDTVSKIYTNMGEIVAEMSETKGIAQRANDKMDAVLDAVLVNREILIDTFIETKSNTDYIKKSAVDSGAEMKTVRARISALEKEKSDFREAEKRLREESEKARIESEGRLRKEVDEAKKENTDRLSSHSGKIKAVKSDVLQSGKHAALAAEKAAIVTAKTEFSEIRIELEKSRTELEKSRADSLEDERRYERIKKDNEELQKKNHEHSNKMFVYKIIFSIIGGIVSIVMIVMGYLLVHGSPIATPHPESPAFTSGGH